MKRLLFILHLSSFILFSSCAPSPASTPQLIAVYATPAAQPWLSELYDCADSASLILNLTPDAPQILLRLGEPADLSTPAYQIDTEDILIVVHRASPVQNLALAQARDLFAGRGDPSLQIWVYDSSTDVQAIFDQTVMRGWNITSSARLAADPQQMSDLLNSDPTAVGILPRRWKTGDTREVFVIPSIPVLAITPSEPQGALRDLIACLQGDE
ncbi:MAG: hypothetical protein AB1750_09250 [Chloroflexota bacterium]